MCPDCERLLELLKEADSVIRRAYVEMARVESDGHKMSRSRFNRHHFDQVAIALRSALSQQNRRI